jgi:4-carboxymuconolactone decarboxylase
MTAAQRQVYDNIAKGPRGRVQGPFPPLLRSPGLADPVQQAGAYIRYESSLPGKLRELAILTVAKHWRARYEWQAHSRIAATEGLGADVIEAVRTGRAPPFADDGEAVVHGFCHEVLTTRRASDARFEAAKSLVGEAGVVDLVGLMGYYSLISFTLNVFQVEPPDGARPLED